MGKADVNYEKEENVFCHCGYATCKARRPVKGYSANFTKESDLMARDVMCTVENCRYWENGHKCNAGEIEVNVDGGGHKAGYTGETNCHTFESKSK